MKKILCFLAFFVACFTLSSCGGGGNEELYLSDPIILEDGSGTKYILYNYYGDEVGSFIVPAPIRGEDGKEGIGIIDITSKPNPDGTDTTLIIFTFSDGTIQEETVANGVSVIGVEQFNDEDGNPSYILLKFSDGNTSSEPIYLPKGKDGVGIVSFTYEFDPDLNKYVMDVKFSDETFFYKEFDPPKDGNGVEYMISGDPAIEIIDGKEKYVVLIKYTDSETPEKLYLDKPLDPNKWYTSSDYKSEDNIPNPRHGDFYFDTQYKLIKLYEDGKWRTIVEFNTGDDKYDVTFILNASLDHPASMPSGWKDFYPDLPHGIYGIGDAGIPIPSRPGYKFVGWCTKQEVTPTSAFFTDLTPLLSDLTLYAIWEIKEYTISFDTNGLDPIDSITQIFDTTLSAPELPEVEGYEYNYYYNGSLVEFPSEMPGMDITLEVRLEPIEYTISFDTDGGTEIDPITLAYGATIEAPENPEKEGYTFIGWDIEIPATMPVGGLSIKALWQENI